MIKLQNLTQTNFIYNDLKDKEQIIAISFNFKIE